jgi:HEAT repeat protein
MTPAELQDIESAGTELPERSYRAVGELCAMLDKTIRARRLYQTANPVYQGFLESLRTAWQGIWQYDATLHFIIEEHGFRWEGRLYPVGEGRDSLPFLFYKDGIRYVTFLPGFEEELELFLDVIDQARQADHKGDDVVTLLWEQEFASFQYGYVDLLAEGIQLPHGEPGTPPIDTGLLTADLGAAMAGAAAGASDDAPASLGREDFEETLYFLSEAELRKVQEEVRTEWERDLHLGVASALFDRLEDGRLPRQQEILGILRQILPTFLAGGELHAAAYVLRELDALLENGLGEELAAEASGLFDQLSDARILGQFILILENGQIRPDIDELRLFLSHLRPASLPILLSAAESTTVPELRERLRSAIDRLGASNSALVGDLLDQTEDVAATIGAARLAGRLRLLDTAPRLASLLGHADPAVRVASVDALVALRSGAAIGALQQVLGDADREVRVAAARGLGSLRYAPARPRFEQALQDRAMRAADLTEKIAFFEAYGALAGGEGVPLLDRILTGRRFLGRRPPPDMRACAALGLGRIGTPAARSVLERAAADEDPVVRSAATRALRQEAVR